MTPKKEKKQIPIDEKALDLLSRRRLTRGELRIKLLIRRYLISDIELLLNRYEESGLLNDRELAFDYAQHRLEELPMGQKRLKFELLKRRITNDLAEEVVQLVYEDLDEEELAQKALRMIMKETKDKAKVWRRITKLGFTIETVENVTRNIIQCD
jgi:regulatory protein